MVEFCNTCEESMFQPEWGGCDFVPKSGGIPHLVFLRCTKDYVHPHQNGWANIENWRASICAGVIYFTGEVLGEKPKDTATKKKLSSCKPEQVVGVVKTLNFKDYNSDKSGYTDVDFWNGITANEKSLMVGWVMCGDLVYMASGEPSIDVSDVIEPNNTDNHYYDGSITWMEKQIIKPVLVTGINELLNDWKNTVDCYL